MFASNSGEILDLNSVQRGIPRIQKRAQGAEVHRYLLEILVIKRRPIYLLIHWRLKGSLDSRANANFPRLVDELVTQGLPSVARYILITIKT